MKEAPEALLRLATGMEAYDLQHAVDMLVAFRAGLSGAKDVTGA